MIPLSSHMRVYLALGATDMRKEINGLSVLVEGTFVVGRNNWLFADHPNGAHASATLFSLIETARACALKPYRYLRFLFGMLPRPQTAEEMPNRVTATGPIACGNGLQGSPADGCVRYCLS